MSLRSRLGMFVLTRQEQRTIAFIVLVVVLGLATKHYRRTHSPGVESGRVEAGATFPASPSPSATPVPHR